MVGGKKEIAITINPDGSVQVETVGVKGKSCVDMVKFLEESLGQATNKKLKPDYYEREGYITDSITTRE